MNGSKRMRLLPPSTRSTAAASGPPGRRGGALLFALICLTLVAGVAYSLLRVSTFVSRRQATSTDDKRAFYLAEAGLAEAYFGLARGYTGVLGASDAPVRLGDGLGWVEAFENEDGSIRLRSTGMCGSGRSTLEIVVEPVELELGIFVDEQISLDAPFLVDGFDSSLGPYAEQLASSALTVDPSWPFLNVDTANQVVFYHGKFYRYHASDGDTYYYDGDYFDPRDHPELAATYDIDPDDFIDHEPPGPSPDFRDVEYVGVLDYFGDVTLADLVDVALGRQVLPPPPELPVTDQVVESSLGPTTGVDGAISSNGPIRLSSPDLPVEIFGDVLHGMDDSLSLSNVDVGGVAGALPGEVELDPVEVPEVDWLPGFVHDSAVPRVLVPGAVGYQFAQVAADSELVVVGPGTATFGDLELASGGRLTLDNVDQPVELLITGHAGFAPGSQVDGASDDPADLVLKVAAGPDPVDLFASSSFHGGVYAPGSHVSIGAGFELFGWLAARTLSLEAGTRLHFDRGLDDSGGSLLLPRLIGWRIEEIPASVRQNRTDPFKLFYSSEVEVEAAQDALVSDCWSMVATEWADVTKLPGYSGPADVYVPDPRATWVTIRGGDLTPPESGSNGNWMVRATYKKGASTVTYEGQLQDLPDVNNMLYEWSVWSQ